MERELGRILLEQSNLGVMVLDAETRVLLWNEWLVHQSGKSPDQALGRRLIELFPHLPDRTLQALEQVQKTGLPRILSPIIFPNYFPLQENMRQFVRLIPFLPERGEIPHLAVLIQDVTAQLEYEEVLEERFRLMLEGVKDYALILTDIEGKITQWDVRAERIFGYEAREMVNTSWFRLFSEEGRRDVKQGQNLWQKASKTGRWEEQVRLVRKDKSPFGAYLVLTALKDHRGRIRGFSLMVRDMSEHLQAKQALWDSLAQRRELEKEREKTLERLRQAVTGAVEVISQTVEMRDPYTAGHQKRVSQLAWRMAQEMKMSPEKMEGVGMAGSIHDLGKISVPAEILVKPTRLTDLEYRLIRVHPESGYHILKNILFPWPLAEIVLQHHERMDGSGYPRGLKGEEILLEARILAVADVVEAMASHRPYRPALGIEAALEEIESGKGSLYDPPAAEACLRLFQEKGFSFED